MGAVMSASAGFRVEVLILLAVVAIVTGIFLPMVPDTFYRPDRIAWMATSIPHMKRIIRVTFIAAGLILLGVGIAVLLTTRLA